jgi:two-component system sensor histidine kinase DegS
MAPSVVSDLLAQGVEAMDRAGRQLKELAKLAVDGADPARARATAKAVEGAIARTRSLLQQIAEQWEGFEARYRVGERIIKAQEEERRHVAREIHDGPAQSMANVVLRAEICEKLLSAGRPEVVQELQQMKMLVKESLREVRKIIFELRPMALDDLGLVPTLFRYLENLCDQYAMNVSLEVIGEERRLSSTLEVALFRMVQESVNNARKHSQANHVQVKLEFLPDKVVAIVQDDGVGFDVEEVQRAWHSRQSFGLMGMRERIELLDGEFEVISCKGAGTTVTARLPIVTSQEEEAAADQGEPN